MLLEEIHRLAKFFCKGKYSYFMKMLSKDILHLTRYFFLALHSELLVFKFS
jgi:hypothetical protein